MKLLSSLPILFLPLLVVSRLLRYGYDVSLSPRDGAMVDPDADLSLRSIVSVIPTAVLERRDDLHDAVADLFSRASLLQLVQSELERRIGEFGQIGQYGGQMTLEPIDETDPDKLGGSGDFWPEEWRDGGVKPGRKMVETRGGRRKSVLSKGSKPPPLRGVSTESGSTSGFTSSKT